MKMGVRFGNDTSRILGVGQTIQRNVVEAGKLRSGFQIWKPGTPFIVGVCLSGDI